MFKSTDLPFGIKADFGRHIDASLGSLTVTIPQLPTDQYILAAVNDTNLDWWFGSSPVFTITA